MDTSNDFESVKQAFTEAGQGHVFQYFDEYSDEEKTKFLNQLSQINLEEIDMLYHSVCTGKKPAENDIMPLDPTTVFIADQYEPQKKREMLLRGAKAIKEGTVAVLILAGGMGS